MLKTLAGAVMALVVAASPAHAQDPAGVIEGGVTDRTAAAVPAARVVAKNLDTGFTRETATASDGFYRLASLPVGQST
jgi:hypothetical protein